MKYIRFIIKYIRFTVSKKIKKMSDIGRKRGRPRKAPLLSNHSLYDIYKSPNISQQWTKDEDIV